MVTALAGRIAFATNAIFDGSMGDKQVRNWNEVAGDTIG
jgi:hypothetical protein